MFRVFHVVTWCYLHNNHDVIIKIQVILSGVRFNYWLPWVFEKNM